VSRRSFRAISIVLLLLAQMHPTRAQHFEPRDALWSVVRACQLAKATLGIPTPCIDIRSSSDGFSVAILRAPFTGAHFLVVPLSKISGIEALELRGPAGGAYLSAAWMARGELHNGADIKDWDSVGMAINSARNRSQDQLHIHVDCLTAQARASFKTLLSIDDRWKLLSNGLWARVVRTEDMRVPNPFAKLLDGLPPGRDSLAAVNLGIAGVQFLNGTHGFVLLTSKTMSFERILDASCGVLRQ
jgi:CDP-diacylglycerol pyrophosphatase